MPDSLRLALGTLTAVRVPPPRRVDRSVARGAMLLAPVVGLLLGTAAAVVLVVVRVVAPDHRDALAVDGLGAVLAVSALALLTRGLHLDGLADTADGLGVKATGEGSVQRRLDVMRAPDIGAFGVATMVLVLLAQVAALTVCSIAGYGTVALVTAAVTGRLATTWACTSPVPSARADGLGAVVARSVPVAGAVLVSLVSLSLVAGLGLLDDDGSVRTGVVLVGSALGGLVVAALALRHCVGRFGGVTGDVLGALVEITTLTTLVGAALAL